MGLVLGGSARVRIEFDVVLTTAWSIVALTDVTQRVCWDVESSCRHWYRIESECASPSCANTNLDRTGDGCNGTTEILGQSVKSGNKYIQVVPARSVAHLCQLISKPMPPFYTPAFPKWKIKSIKRYNQNTTWRYNKCPSIMDETDSVTPLTNCVKMVEEEFWSVPECAEFSLDIDQEVTYVGAYTWVQDKFLTYRGAGGIVLSGIAKVRIETGEEVLSLMNFSPRLPRKIKPLQEKAQMRIMEASPDEDLLQCVGCFTILSQEEIEYSFEDNFPTGLSIVNGTAINTCGCADLALKLTMLHNLYDCYVLRDFINRNGKILPKQFELLYIQSNKIWRGAWRYAGVSANGNETEDWSIVASLECTKELEDYTLSEDVWKYSLMVTKKGSGGMNRSRVIIAQDQKVVCDGITMSMVFSLDTNTGLATDGNGGIIDYTILYDEIGLFSGSHWANYPFLEVQVDEVDSGETSTLGYNITPLFPK